MRKVLEILIHLFPFIFGYSFYFAFRWYLNKYKGYDLPFMFERYHDDLKRTYTQLLIFGTGLIIGFIITFILIAKFDFN